MANQDNLTVLQEKAIQLLMTGRSDQAVADELDMARQTVNNWRHNDAAFAARFNAERRALWSTHREKLRSLVAQAVDVLAEDMAATLEPKLRQSAAIHVLKAVGLYGQNMTPSNELGLDQVELKPDWLASDVLKQMLSAVEVTTIEPGR
jgi:hypothetical protein